MDLAALPSHGSLAARHELELLELRSVIAEYVAAVVRRPEFDADGRLADPVGAPAVVYSALCGVGSQTLGHAFAAAGLPPPAYVEHQRHPDGSFPGLPFPNPEEPGTLDDAIALASQSGTDVILANDPDADRLAAAVRDRDGAWRQLSGDELGTLLCDWMISLTADRRPERPLISASSVVSGRMVQALCAARGVAHHRTLTGFKWIMEPLLTHPEAQWVFGYEEALGYSVTDAVRDKDGIAAAVEFTRMIGALASRGVSPLERLDELAAEVGVWVTSAASVRADAQAMHAALSRLRSRPPAVLAGRPVVTWVDWLHADAAARTDLIEYELAAGTESEPSETRGASVRVCVRPSGTEPKAKIYLEASMPSPSDIRTQRGHLRGLLDAVSADLLALLDLSKTDEASADLAHGL